MKKLILLLTIFLLGTFTYAKDWYSDNSIFNLVFSSTTNTLKTAVGSGGSGGTVYQGGYWIVDSTSVVSKLDTLFKQNQMIGNTEFYALPTGIYNISGSSVSVPGGVNVNNFPANYIVIDTNTWALLGNLIGETTNNFRAGQNIGNTGFNVSNAPTVFLATTTINNTNFPDSNLYNLINSTTTINDERYKGKNTSDIKTTLSASGTTTFYGYGTSYLVTITGSTMTWTNSWGSGTQTIDGTYSEKGIGDSFAVPTSSPTTISVNFPSGTGVSANVYISGLQ